MTRRWKSTLAVAIVLGAVVGAGCASSHQETDQTLPPYASISDEGSNPSSLPKPPEADEDYDSGGGFWSSVGSALMAPVHLLFW